MSDSVFVDTNVVIYLYSADESEKRRRSQELIDSHDSIVSMQVLNEFSNILRKKFKFEYDVIDSAIKELFTNFTVVAQNLQTIFSAFSIGKRYGYSYYDSLIIATALEHDCKILYSEDLQHDQIIEDTLRIVNPFV
jgi:predicted nucleic acid-binding protein